MHRHLPVGIGERQRNLFRPDVKPDVGVSGRNIDRQRQRRSRNRGIRGQRGSVAERRASGRNNRLIHLERIGGTASRHLPLHREASRLPLRITGCGRQAVLITPLPLRPEVLEEKLHGIDLERPLVVDLEIGRQGVGGDGADGKRQCGQLRDPFFHLNASFRVGEKVVAIHVISIHTETG